MSGRALPKHIRASQRLQSSAAANPAAEREASPRQASMGAQNSKPPDRVENAEKTGVYARRAAGLTVVPEKVWTLGNLRTLDLSENKLATEAIKRLGGLSKLKTLSIDSNKLTSLPVEICTLNDLTALSVANNSLASLPDALGALSKLKTLNVARNALTALPESMCAMASLATLDASSNKLQSLPAGIGHLASLVSANLSNNHLGALPASGYSGLKRLKDLDLRQNAPLVVHGSVPAELLLDTPLHRLELDVAMLEVDGLLSETAAGGNEAREAYIVRRKARIDKEMHSKDRGGEIRFGQ